MFTLSEEKRLHNSSKLTLFPPSSNVQPQIKYRTSRYPQDALQHQKQNGVSTPIIPSPCRLREGRPNPTTTQHLPLLKEVRTLSQSIRILKKCHFIEFTFMDKDRILSSLLLNYASVLVGKEKLSIYKAFRKHSTSQILGITLDMFEYYKGYTRSELRKSGNVRADRVRQAWINISKPDKRQPNLNYTTIL